VIFFNLQPDILNAEVMQAELNIYIRNITWGEYENVYIGVHRILKSGDSYVYENQPDIRHRVDATNVGFEKINLKNIVHIWQRSRENYGLYVTAYHVYTKPFAVIQPRDALEEPMVSKQI
jgi:CRISPR/Cas system CMR-associated protein Cmr3 (group 5 of RAMP superfamily)